MRCSRCRQELPEGSRYCPACGEPIDPDSVATLVDDTPAPVDEPSGTERAKPRFLPGHVIAGRYRIVAILGRGGMGEVYRADDLKLGEPVALKFLPDRFEHDPQRLALLLEEVKIARQITHSNVCRVFDLGEADGHHFLSMEFIDGEDLAGLLRRIGRLPGEKAVQMARQLCAGLDAAHRQGILHRDLKPSNVMIDGRGQVRVTDFGLAGWAGRDGGHGAHGGTPAYMAPEQLAGEAATAQSDLYALGLVLLELFTGEATHAGTSIDELIAYRAEHSPPSLSDAEPALDPGVRRAIRSCLQNDPALRPRSTVEVAAALPQGTTLAAVLQAGETPSPQMVADAGGHAGLRKGPAGGLLLAALLALLLLAMSWDSVHVVGRVPLDKPPEALAVQAREMLEKIGFTQRPADWAYGFQYDRLQPAGVSRPSPIRFWYRQSPRFLIPLDFQQMFVTPDDPPPVVSGMSEVRFDSEGKLLRIFVMPPQLDVSDGERGEPDWAPLFARAGLVLADFRPTEGTWHPYIDRDLRRAWLGTYPGQPAVPVRVEAGAYGGRPVFFRVVLPWTEPERMGPVQGPAPLNLALLALLLLLLAGGVWLARTQFLRGSGDRRGAWRVALAWFFSTMVIWLMVAHHVPNQSETGPLFKGIAMSLLKSGMGWVIYMALEPYARRLWPQALVSWNRLLAGRWSDPLVGRDVLVGAAAGLGLAVVHTLPYLAPMLGGGPEPVPDVDAVGGFSEGILYSFTGVRQALGFYLFLPQLAVANGIGTVFLLLLVQGATGRRWIALIAVYLLFALLTMLAGTPTAAVAAVALASPAVLLLVVTRYGMLALMFTFAFFNLPAFCRLSFDLSPWYAGRSLLLLAVMAGVVLYGYSRATSAASHVMIRG